MPKYNFEVPRPRGAQPINDCPVSESNKPACAKDIILHMLLARVATEGGETVELSTIFNPLINALDIDVPEDILQAVESIGVGPNLQRFLDWVNRSNPFDDIQFATDATPEHSEGLIFYDNEAKALAVYNDVADITLQVGQEQWIAVRNESGAAIENGAAVYISGASGGYPLIDLAQANSENTAFVIGLATHTIANNSNGFVTTSGMVNDVDTSSFSAGDILFLSETTAGGYQATKPDITTRVGTAVTSSTTGKIFVRAVYANYYTKEQIDLIISSIAAGGTTVIPNQVIVAKGGGGSDENVFLSVEEAIDFIDGLAGGDQPAADNPYVILVSAGLYTEDNPLVIPSYVSVQGQNDEVSIIQALNNNDPLFVASDESQVYNLRIDGPTNDAGILAQGGVETEIVRVAFKNCLIGLHADGVGTQATIEESKFKSTTTTGMQATDSASINSSNILSEAATTHFYANGGSIWIHNSGTTGGTNGLYANNGGTIDVNLCTLIGTTNVVRANNSSNISGIAVESRGASTWDVLQEDASTIDLSSCRFVATKLSMFDADELKLSFDSDLEGDEGLILYEELQVGSPEIGRESVFGEGDSYTRGMLVYTETAGNVFADVSTEAASASGSTFTFPGVAQNNAIYVSSDLQDDTDYKQFLGIKIANTTAAVLGVGSIATEYWNGAAWTAFNVMAADADSPYDAYANVLFTRANASEQLRFDDIRTNWTKNDPPATGTNRYWVRFRIATAVTTVPVFEQFKVHSNRTEINADGFVEYMGLARTRRKLPAVHIGNKQPLVGASPANEDVDFGSVINFSVSDNEFANGTTDGFGQMVAVPEGLDTSLPLEFTVRWAPTTDAASGDVVLDLKYGIIKVGTVLDGTNAELTASDLVTTTLNTAEQVYESTISFYTPTAVLGDTIALALIRQAAGSPGPTGDTYNGNIYVISVLLQGYFWH